LGGWSDAPIGLFNTNNIPRVNSINGTAFVVAAGTIGAIAGFLWMDDFQRMAHFKARINNGAAAGAVAGVIVGSMLTGSTWLAQRA